MPRFSSMENSPQTLAPPTVFHASFRSEQVGPGAVGAIEVVFGARRGRVDDAAFLVDGKLAPNIGAADGLPCVFRPGVVTELAGMWNRVEGPDQSSAAHVEGADIAGGRAVSLIRRRAENQQILKHLSGRCGLNQSEGSDIAAQAFLQIDAAILAESEDRLPRTRVDGPQDVVAGEQQPTVAPVLVFPVVDSPVRDNVSPRRAGIGPDLFSGGRIQGDDRIVLRSEEHTSE